MIMEGKGHNWGLFVSLERY